MSSRVSDPEQVRFAAVAVCLLGGCSFDGSSQLDDAPRIPDSTLGPDASPDAPPQPLTNAPIAYWPFDIDGRDRRGAHDGTLIGTAAITTGSQGVRGEALRLAADGDRVDIGAPASFDFNADFTWHIYFKSAEGSGALFSRNPLATAWNQGSKAMFVRSDRVQWDTGWVGNPQMSENVDDERWHQVIARYVAATDQLDVFLDPQVGDTMGRLSTTHNVNSFDEHTHVHNSGLAETGFSIGAANFTGGLNDLNTLVGLIDEAAVFDVALTADDLDRLIQSGPAGFFPGAAANRALRERREPAPVRPDTH